MHLFMVNDDGIDAPGIRVMAECAVEAGHKITIFAPDKERSCSGHSFSPFKILKEKNVNFKGINAYMVNGTPVDCVRLGLFLINEPVDFVFSGINNGPNLGAATLYSGTVNAAMEASMLGVPSLAISLTGFPCDDYKPAAKLGIKVFEWVLRHPAERGEIYSMNVPNIPENQIKGVRVANLSHDFFTTPNYIRDKDGWRIGGLEAVIEDTDEECDLHLVRKGYVTLTKLTWKHAVAVSDEVKKSIKYILD